MIKIVHIITGLGSGGAENMLYKLLRYSDKSLYYHEVISLLDEGTIGEKIKAEGIKVHSLNLTGKNLIKSLIIAKKICEDVDIVNTWLYHADIFGFILGKIFLKKKLIWNIRHSNLEKEVNKSITLKIVRLNAFLSKKVDHITFNSKQAFKVHRQVGYSYNQSTTVPNGFELNKFKFNYDDRERIRKELSISLEEKVFITVGRWNLQKDYHTLIRGLSELRKQNVRFKMIMVGTNLDWHNKELTEMVNNYGLRENMILLGRRSDISNVLSVGDVYISSSVGESFSNAIGEAMACELPCVVTDVGDSKIIVGDTGLVIDAKDYLGLANKLFTMVNDVNLKELGKQARKRVVNNYDIREVVKLYEKIYNV